MHHRQFDIRQQNQRLHIQHPPQIGHQQTERVPFVGQHQLNFFELFFCTSLHSTSTNKYNRNDVVDAMVLF